MQKKVFVTGAGGFVGSYILKSLNMAGASILAHDIKGAKFSVEGIRSCDVDLKDKQALSQVIRDFAPDSVIHLAAIASPTYGNIAEIYDVNVNLSEILLDVIRDNCPKGTRVVLTSTAGVYGNSDKAFISENSEYNPQNHYSFSKMVMEYISRAYKDDLDVKIIRPFNMIGCGQKENFLIPKLVRAYVQKQDVLKVGNLNTVRDYVDIEYAAKVFCKMALTDETEYDVLNICSGHGVKGTEILHMLQELTSFSPRIEVDPKFLRKNEIMQLVGDPTRCNAFMGDEKPKKIEHILKHMVDFYLS